MTIKNRYMKNTQRFHRVNTPEEQIIFDKIKLEVELRLKKLGQTKAWLAGRMNVSPSRISMLLKDQSRGEIWNVLELDKLRKILGVSVILTSKGIFILEPENK